MAHNAVTLVDSPFSITGNVVGILTFLLGLFASYIALHTLARDSEEELIEFLDDVWNTSDQIQEVIRIARCARELDLAIFADSTFLRRSLGLTENLLNKLLKELTSGSTPMKGQQHLPRSRPPRKTYLFDFRLRRRIVWIFSRTRLLAEMRRLEALKADVYMAQNGYLLEQLLCVELCRQRNAMSAISPDIPPGDALEAAQEADGLSLLTPLRSGTPQTV